MSLNTHSNICRSRQEVMGKLLKSFSWKCRAKAQVLFRRDIKENKGRSELSHVNKGKRRHSGLFFLLFLRSMTRALHLLKAMWRFEPVWNMHWSSAIICSEEVHQWVGGPDSCKHKEEKYSLSMLKEGRWGHTRSFSCRLSTSSAPRFFSTYKSWN